MNLQGKFNHVNRYPHIYGGRGCVGVFKSVSRFQPTEFHVDFPNGNVIYITWITSTIMINKWYNI